ncbi:MAG TPA: DUF3159 domain-containing protein [Marmoricola sp.]|nr:DUF3159 domain-containing protein [Marmoricola sp.]
MQPGATPAQAGEQTVESVVRQHLAKALGGRRGMLEAAVPTIVFTVLFLTLHDLRVAVLVSLGCALVLLVVRLAQRSTPQFVLNSLVGIGVGALFAWRAAQGGGDAGDQALAYFLPGILYNAGYAVVMVLTILTRWPVVGFMVGSVTGDPTAWHSDRAVVRLCSNLTWLLVLPCVLRVLVQAPMYLAGRNGWWPDSAAVAALGTAKLLMGWPLQVVALAAMVWLLSRNRTPLEAPAP